MTLNDLVRSSQGLMVGDYSTADVIPSGPFAGNSISAFAVGQSDKTLNQAMFVPTQGMPITAGTTASQAPSAAEVQAAKTAPARQEQDLPPSVDRKSAVEGK